MGVSDSLSISVLRSRVWNFANPPLPPKPPSQYQILNTELQYWKAYYSTPGAFRTAILRKYQTKNPTRPHTHSVELSSTMANRDGPVRFVEWKSGAPNAEEKCAAKIKKFELLSSKRGNILPIACTVSRGEPIKTRTSKPSADTSDIPATEEYKIGTRRRLSASWRRTVSTKVFGEFTLSEIVKELPNIKTADLVQMKQHIDLILAGRAPKTMEAKEDLDGWDIVEEEQFNDIVEDQFDIVKSEELQGSKSRSIH